MRKFLHKSEIECPVSALFAWHLRQRAFERLTPPWLDVHVKGMPKLLQAGLRMDLTIRKYGVPVNCRFEITELETDKKFVDVQVQGPFAYWRHEHRFHALADERSLMDDEIHFSLPMGFAFDGFVGPFMERDMSRLFRYRHEVLKQDLAAFMRNRLKPRQKVLLLGEKSPLLEPLMSYLATQGHSLVAGGLERQQIEALNVHEGASVCINIVDRQASGLPAEDLISKHLVNDRSLNLYIEVHDAYAGDNSNEDFERRCQPLREASVRCLYVRTGAILLPAFGVLKTNRNWRSQTLPWIAVDDALAAIEQCMFNDTVTGQIHMSANQKKPPTKEFKTLFDIEYPFRYSTLKEALNHVLE